MGERYYVQGGYCEYIYSYSTVATSKEEAIEKYYTAFTVGGECRATNTRPWASTENDWPSGCQSFNEAWQYEGAVYKSGGYNYSL